MIHSVRFIAVLDTNVIFPIIIRDLLFWFAYYDMYIPKWSDNIFDEWKAVMMRKGVSEDEALKRVQKANKAFPNALVTNYHALIGNLKLPDKNDRHVLAAAISANAKVIVTNNLKDFPLEYLYSHGLTAKSPDTFLTEIIDLNPDKAKEAFKEMLRHRKNPVMTIGQALESLRKNGLNHTANYLHTLV